MSAWFFAAIAVLDDMQAAIRVATSKLGLQPGAAFQARVAQLAELVSAHKLVSSFTDPHARHMNVNAHVMIIVFALGISS